MVDSTLVPINLGFIPSIGGYEWLIILLIILILFGAKKLPELARGMGEAIREFRKASREEQEGILSKSDEGKVVKIAKSLNIETKGKTKEELVKEIMNLLAKEEKAQAE